MVRAVDDDAPLRSLGGYLLLEKIGEGGMGSVYLAEDTRTRRRVALKVLARKQTLEPRALLRFRREAETVFRLHHPNLVRGYEAGEDQGYPYCVMEYCEGESLDRRLQREGPLPWKSALELMLPVARALGYAHDQGLIHRDIKPSNLLLGKDGQVKVLDLGLSKNIIDLDQSYRTQTGVAVGTPHYMAPEQAEGAKDIDGRADIYALGMTLYHLLTGQTPFPGSSPFEVIAKHLNARLPDPRTLRPDLPESMVHIFRKMTALRPDDRYRDCAQLLEDLEAVQSGGAPLTPPVKEQRSDPTIGRSPKAGRRSETPLRRAGIAAVAILALALIGLLFLKPPPRKSPPPPSAAENLAPATEEALTDSWKADVDLLAKLVPARQAVVGPWKMEQGTLISGRLPGSRIQFAYEPPREYDYRIEFTRLEGQDEVVQICSRLSTSFAWRMDDWQTKSFGFLAQVEDPERRPAARAHDALKNGRRYVSMVRVRDDGCEAFLDGWLVGSWKTDFRRMSAPLPWALNSDRLLGVGAQESIIAVHRAEVREISGRGRFYDPPRHTLVRSLLTGQPGGSAFEEVIDEPLIGFQYALSFLGDGPLIGAIRGIYRREDGSAQRGGLYGVAKSAFQEVVAKPGYAVGAVTTFADIRLRGFRIRMMRIRGDPPVLDPTDFYDEAWRGKAGGATEQTLGGDGSPIIGIHGKSGADVDALGLISLQSGSAPAPNAPAATRSASLDGLLVHLEMDEIGGTTIRDSSGRGNDGYLIGGAKRVVGKIGESLRFGEEGGRGVIPTLWFDAPEVALCAWIRPASTEARQELVRLGESAAVLRSEPSGTLVWSVKVDGRIESLPVPKALSPGVWTHLAGTWDGGTLRLYKDGVEIGSRPAAGTLAPGRGLTVGSRLEPVRGDIDDVRLYGRAPSAQRVRFIMEDIPVRLKLRPPDESPRLLPGLKVEFYTSAPSLASEMERMPPSSAMIVDRFDISMFRPRRGYGVRFSGYVDVPRDGLYTFTVVSYDSLLLQIGTTEVVSSPGGGNSSKNRGTIALKAGKHLLRLLVAAHNPLQHLQVLWEGTSLDIQEIPPETLFVPADVPGYAEFMKPPPVVPGVLEGLELLFGPEPRPRGITQGVGWDAELEEQQREGKPCVRMAPNRVSSSRYLVCSLETRWHPSWGGAEVSIEYLDEGEGTFGLEFDSTRKPYQDAEQVVTLRNSRTWKVASFTLPDPVFRGRQNNGGDFRLTRNNTDLWIHRVSLRLLKPGQAVVPLPKPESSGSAHPGGFATNWLLLGPLRIGAEYPELNEAAQKKIFDRSWIQDPARSLPRAGEKATVNGVELSWEPVKTVDFALNLFGEESTYFVVVYVFSPSDRENLTLSIGSDDSSAWWLNGAEVLRVVAARGVGIDQNKSPRPVTLKKGRNTLLAQVVNVKGPSGACARFLDSDGMPVTDLRFAISPEIADPK